MCIRDRFEQCVATSRDPCRVRSFGCPCSLRMNWVFGNASPRSAQSNIQPLFNADRTETADATDDVLKLLLHPFDQRFPYDPRGLNSCLLYTSDAADERSSV